VEDDHHHHHHDAERHLVGSKCHGRRDDEAPACPSFRLDLELIISTWCTLFYI
jgi:hypothetical protein